MRLPWSEIRLLLCDLGLFVAKVGGGTLLLTGIVVGFIGLARDDALLSRRLLVCSPEERSALAEINWRGDAKPVPEPQISTGACVASFDAPESPVRASVRFSERLRTAGWRVQPRTATGGAKLFGGALLTATKARFTCEVVYLPSSAGPPGRSDARVRVRLEKL